MNIFFAVPAFLRFLSISEIIGFVGYVIMVAIVEITVVVLIIIIFGIVLPTSFLKDRFVSQGTLSILVFAFWATVLQAQGDQISNWHFEFLVIEFILITVMLIRFKKIDRLVYSLVDRATPLSWFYLFFDFIIILFSFIRYAILV
jgi:hypothetical protein